MGLFGKKKESVPIIEYNPETQRPVLKCSICNGEQVAGFKDKQTGHFTEVMLIKNGLAIKGGREDDWISGQTYRKYKE